VAAMCPLRDRSGASTSRVSNDAPNWSWSLSRLTSAVPPANS
jgi:hypothetical protein